MPTLIPPTHAYPYEREVVTDTHVCRATIARLSDGSLYATAQMETEVGPLRHQCTEVTREHIVAMIAMFEGQLHTLDRLERRAA